MTIADELLARLEGMIRFIVEADCAYMPVNVRETPVLHLTGAVFVEVSPLLPVSEIDRMAREVGVDWPVKPGADPASPGGDPSADSSA